MPKYKRGTEQSVLQQIIKKREESSDEEVEFETDNTKTHVLFSGSRDWTSKDSVIATLKTLDAKKHIILQGGCKGLDVIAKEQAHIMGFEVVTVMADWDNFRKSAGPKRNEKMIREYDPKKAYLFSADIEHSIGTRNARDLCKRFKVPFTIIKK